MYFEFFPNYRDEDLSWIICKNPSNKFERTDGNIEINGWFDENENDNIIKYCIESDIIPEKFIKYARDNNLPTYVHPYLGSVNPISLKGIITCLRSAIRGSNDSNNTITDDQVTTKKKIFGKIGPFSKDFEYVKETFEEFKIDIQKEEINNLKTSYMCNIETMEEMSICEFLQKIYIGCLFLTYNMNLSKLDENIINKFINLCSNWINNISIKDKIINKLTRNHIGFKSQLKDGVDYKENEKDNTAQNEFREQKIKMHELRHEFVIQCIKKYPIRNIVDIGSGEGSLARKLSSTFKNIRIKYFGLEKNSDRVRKSNIKNGDFTFYNCDILYPDLELFLKPDLLTCIEVIEHLSEEGRKLLIENIKTIYCPNNLIITTPNYDYNKNFGNEFINEDGSCKYRHKGHKIEYNQKQLYKEVIDPLSEIYDFYFAKLNKNEEEQMTFCLLGIKKENVKLIPNMKKFNKMKERTSSIYLTDSNYVITKKETAIGYSNRQVTQRPLPFYLSPTMSPVEFNEKYPEYLEDPRSAFDYYQERGINKIVSEYKYMGSRAHILIFKNIEFADLMGFESQVAIISRSGFSFFSNMENGEEYLDQILCSINNENIWRDDIFGDFIILDAEIMPWSLKSKKYTNWQFRSPIESLLISRKLGKKDINTCEKYLDTLDVYDYEGNIEIRPFHILSYGNIDKNRKTFINYKLYTKMNHIEHLDLIQRFCEKSGDQLFKFDNESFEILYLDDEEKKEYIVDKWETYCVKGCGEGFVFKPYEFSPHSNSDYPIQQALKVRGPEYLRLVYGVDYLEDRSYFDKIKYRKVKSKRQQSVQQQELSKNILKCFLRKNEFMQRKFVAAFLGMESLNIPKIDATL